MKRIVFGAICFILGSLLGAGIDFQIGNGDTRQLIGIAYACGQIAVMREVTPGPNAIPKPMTCDDIQRIWESLK
jgi:hypothetical protein